MAGPYAPGRKLALPTIAEERIDMSQAAILPLVINWHLTEACNFRCHYCYGKWDSKNLGADLVRSSSQRRALIEALHLFFRPDNLENPLLSQLSWDRVRLNLAGGEPLLYAKYLPALLDEARDAGFDTSIITNGSLLNSNMMRDVIPSLSWLGVSLDSVRKTTNLIIGRTDSRDRVLDTDHLYRQLRSARQINPHLRIKINTVVNQSNHHESLADALDSIHPDRWKVLRILPIYSKRDAISQEQFDAFINRHQRFQHVMAVEDNLDMTGTYLMIDPLGRFFQNEGECGNGYLYSDPILEVGVAEAFRQIYFRPAGFASRYLG